MGSQDGVFPSAQKRTITTVYRKARGYSSAYYKTTILEATTDGKGNIKFGYPAWTYTPQSKTGRSVDVEADIIAGYDGNKTFNIDWSKVQSVSGQTYIIKAEAKAAGLRWDGKTKRWIR